ncbi:TB2/DP1, HVA22 family-domain-containing protein, partial [Pyronema omphalodes]
SVATFAFPVFASYKALKSNDPSQLTPWVIYWVVMSCVFFVESWIGWAISWFPFYQDARAIFMLWLVLPQTQGATKLYFEYIHPQLSEHEQQIEEFIAKSHEQAKAAGAEYIQRLIESAKAAIFGGLVNDGRPMTPVPTDAAGYAQHLFNRWKVPQIGNAPQLASDLYSFMSTALNQPPQGQGNEKQHATNLIPPHVKTQQEKQRFIELQRERLKTVMAALESEMEGLEPKPIPKSMSQGNISVAGDFEKVSLSDADSDNGWGKTTQ